MAGGLTYIEVVQANEIHRMRAEAAAGLRAHLGVAFTDRMTDDELLAWDVSAAGQAHREQQRKARLAAYEAQERIARETAAMRKPCQSSEAFIEQRLREQRAAEREPVVCAPHRTPIEDRNYIGTWPLKIELRDALQRREFAYSTPQNIAYEWGYIRALRDMGKTAEADRLEHKMRRGSIFRVEKGKRAAEVKELAEIWDQPSDEDRA